MSYYLIGIIVSMVIYLLVGLLAGRAVKDTNDYYVAGRRAPVILIVGSLIASFLSTGAFLGDTGEVYSGFFIPILIVGVIQGTGYLFGSVCFGRYIRRAKVITVPEYFGKRFNDKKLQVLAGIITIFACTAYMLSAMQGISTLMSAITGLDYAYCVLIAWLSFAVFTIYSGSSGVLITDTIMFLVFLIAALIGIPYIIQAAGGWTKAIIGLANSTVCPGIISAGGNLSYMYDSGTENLIWSVTYGVVWALVVMVSPWQTSRYLMAKDESTVLKSAVYSSIGVITITTLLYFSAAFIQYINPHLIPSQSIIWAAMNLMPDYIGVVLLTGILAAGISSASTFLSLIGFSITNDILQFKNVSVDKQLKLSRIAMVIASLIVLVLAYFNPPQIFWIMYFGGTVIASSWAVVALASIFTNKLSTNGAFYGMILGFIGCVIVKLYVIFNKVTPPIYFDPFFIGIILSMIGCIVGSVLNPATERVVLEYKNLHIGTSECIDVKKYGYVYIAFTICFVWFLVYAYVIPYVNS